MTFWSTFLYVSMRKKRLFSRRRMLTFETAAVRANCNVISIAVNDIQTCKKKRWHTICENGVFYLSVHALIKIPAEQLKCFTTRAHTRLCELVPLRSAATEILAQTSINQSVLGESIIIVDLKRSSSPLIDSQLRSGPRWTLCQPVPIAR